MNDWIRRLLGIPKESPDRQAGQHIPAAVGAADQAACPDLPSKQETRLSVWQPQYDIDGMFFSCLTSTSTESVKLPPYIEKNILDGLDGLIRSELGGADLIPRVPHVIPQLLQSLRNENISGAELSSEIAHDAVLVGEVLRQANSSFYQPREPISSIENAVLILGKNGLRMLIAKAAFRPLIYIQSGRHSKRAAPLLWVQSDKCAQACRILAAESGVDSFTAFLAGLMQNLGMIVAFRLTDQTYDGPIVQASESFGRIFSSRARVLSYLIAQQWQLPEAVVSALKNLSMPANAADGTSIADVVHASDQLSKVRMLIDQQMLTDGDASILTGMPDRMMRCFEQIGGDTES